MTFTHLAEATAEALLWIPCRADPETPGEAIVLGAARSTQDAAEMACRRIGGRLVMLRSPGQPIPRAGDRVSYTGGRPWRARLDRVLR